LVSALTRLWFDLLLTPAGSESKELIVMKSNIIHPKSRIPRFSLLLSLLTNIKAPGVRREGNFRELEIRGLERKRATTWGYPYIGGIIKKKEKA